MEKMEQFGLKLNKQKSQVLKGPRSIEDLLEVKGIPIVPKVTYLGYKIAATKTVIL